MVPAAAATVVAHHDGRRMHGGNLGMRASVVMVVMVPSLGRVRAAGRGLGVVVLFGARLAAAGLGQTHLLPC